MMHRIAFALHTCMCLYRARASARAVCRVPAGYPPGKIKNCCTVERRRGRVQCCARVHNIRDREGSLPRLDTHVPMVSYLREHLGRFSQGGRVDEPGSPRRAEPFPAEGSNSHPSRGPFNFITAERKQQIKPASRGPVPGVNASFSVSDSGRRNVKKSVDARTHGFFTWEVMTTATAARPPERP